MKSRSLLFSVLLLATGAALCGVGKSNARPGDSPVEKKKSFAADVAPFLVKNCYACHGNGKTRGDLALDKFKPDESIQKDRKVWENVLHMVRSGEMPPKEKPRPAGKDVEAFLQALDGLLGDLDCSGMRNVGRVTLHRLNRSEFNNTIRDLIGVDFHPAADFPNDDVGYGFDNIGDVLSVSPLLLERYLAAADTILDRAIVNVEVPKVARNRLPELSVSQGAGEVKRGSAFLTRGNVSAEGYLDEGDYIIRATVYGEQLGKDPVRAALRLGRRELKQFEVKAEQAAPIELEFKTRLPKGTTRLGVGFLNPYSETAPVEKKTEEQKADKAKTKDGKADGKADPAPKGKGKAGDAKAKNADPKKERKLVVRRIEVEGPFNPPPIVLPDSHRRLLAHKADLAPREAAREIVGRLAPRAFRRPVGPEEVERILKVYDKAAQEGETFENRIRLAVARILVSPNFLFRVELDPPGAKAGTSYLINEYELASRLSYFFWSSMPDDELFGLAAAGKLRQNLPAQVRRLLKDPKSSAFFQNFPGQWLTLRGLANVSPDPKLFPKFDAELRDAMYRETELFFETIVREDRNIGDLLDADFSFVNEKLAKHYGIEGVKGKDFRRVKLPSNRGGLLTQASILTLTSNPTRTSAVKRGKWVLDQILNTPPPPPPPDVPPLAETGELKGTMRKMMEMHRANAVCSSCHQRMDPIGFAFENYDAVGAWRDKDGAFAVDASGTLPDGRNFKGPAELKSILKEKKELFGRCISEKLLTYALGRGLEYYDKCAVDTILKALAQNNYRFSTLLDEVIASEPFQMRMATGGK
jgi:Protein of unknown function (DUF1592)/Protein of unknown function (DUF1588)/Protein of unknown function (DUF1587)/Protein of unknown function (DUF1585)/Protein of unknown function (DUF1595)/Planctomycete cytochrome C